MVNKVDLTNSKTIGGAVIAFLGVILLFAFDCLDNWLYNAGYYDMYTALGSDIYYFIMQGIPFILMIIGFVVAIYGIIDSRK